MYNSENFRFLVLTEKSLNQSKVEVENNNITKPQIETVPYAPQLIIPICLIIIGLMMTFMFRSKIWKLPQNNKVTISRFKPVPCKNCQYFSDNNYLNCAVHPATVLSKDALNCSDYLPKGKGR